MAERVYMVWPDGLKDRVREAGNGEITKFVVDLVEERLASYSDWCPECKSPLVQGECWTCS